ncbi:MAG: acetolactate decarboxylase [Acidaminococcaceae bacterium]|nr:acetolactate decarboxylase [Acidaminococcaceae bacterium]
MKEKGDFKENGLIFASVSCIIINVKRFLTEALVHEKVFYRNEGDRMNLKKKCTAAILTGLLACSALGYAAPADRETIQQVALLQSLAQGYFGGTVTVKQLRKVGDIGIGTFKGLNGEMIVLDGKVYQALGSGEVVIADDKDTVPFSNVTFFDKDFTLPMKDIADKEALEGKLNQVVKEKGENSFYMIKLHTTFPSILFRSEYGSEEPYPTLVGALKEKQTEFTHKDITGTVVGLYCPNYMGGLNTPGWHFHFISDDKKHGGHVLELFFQSGDVLMDKTDKFNMLLPDDKSFQTLNLAKDMKEEIRQAEQDKQPSAQKK